MTPGQELDALTARALVAVRAALRERRPGWVVVQGDTTTAFAAALAAFYEKIPVAHVEAGLRSGERYAPFPEEVNRRLVDQLSTVLLAPTAAARRTLLAEGFAQGGVHLTGNTIVDALLATRELLRRDPARAALPPLPPDARVVLVTAHRRESFGAPLQSVCRALARILREERSAHVVYPVHLNPRVNEPVRRILGGEPRALLPPPLGYLAFVGLLDRADVVLTDSGGVQEEAPTFEKPVLVLRDVTERPEGVEAGVARIVGTDEERIVSETLRLLRDPGARAEMTARANPYGDGRAAERIAAILAGEATDEYRPPGA
jgi:UDP-N-acetylglucosamine 2-epimerase (non-hydrolysing)